MQVSFKNSFFSFEGKNSNLMSFFVSGLMFLKKFLSVEKFGGPKPNPYGIEQDQEQ
jgi:hypothetical protein